MTDWIESELKLGLPDERAWRWIRARLGPGRIVEQTNHFFDAPTGSLRAARIGVRVRSESVMMRSGRPAESWTLTLKADAPLASPSDADTRHASRRGPASFLSRRVELEIPLERVHFEAILRDGLRLEPWIERWRDSTGGRARERETLERFLDSLEADLGAQPLRRFAGFTNRREHLSLQLEDEAGQLDLGLELDRTCFPNGRLDFELEVELAETHDGDARRPPDRDENPRGLVLRVQNALVGWLTREAGIQAFPATDKLARLESILAASPSSTAPDGLGPES